MTDKEKAIVMAHTGICMLTGDKFQIFHKYVEDIMGRPIMTHEIGFLADAIKEKSKTDFIALCADKSDLENPNKWIPVTERLPKVKQHVLLSCYGRVIYGRMLSEDGHNGYPIFEICDNVGEKRPIVLEAIVHNEFTTSRIKAWMPLPEPYKAEKGGEV